MAPSAAPSRVTPLEHTAVGALGGMLEVCVMQPMVAFKNALQEGRPLPRTPLALYRGLVINCCSMAPITASQFGTSRLLENAIIKHTGSDITTAGRFASAAGAGSVSALIGSPTELIIIQQQKNLTPLAAETRRFFSAYPAYSIYRGLAPCIARETLYAGGYLGLCPVLFDGLREKGYSPTTAMLVSGVVGGVFAAAASHPFDTIKTRMQAFMYSKPEYMTAAATARTILAEAGPLTFWRGLLPRMTRIVGATFLLINVRSYVVGYLEEKRDPARAAAAEAVAAGMRD
ncbi:MAG: mitochondrial carrier domain-containing protein [Monoraphidium minutum]|nr:MAG: mitochondrial carrier domain-containing protein [Monoraphidium minutum]